MGNCFVSNNSGGKRTRYPRQHLNDASKNTEKPKNAKKTKNPNNPKNPKNPKTTIPGRQASVTAPPNNDWPGFCKDHATWCRMIIEKVLVVQQLLSELFHATPPPVPASKLEAIKRKCHNNQTCINEMTKKYKKSLMRSYLMERTGLVGTSGSTRQTMLVITGFICGILILIALVFVCYCYVCNNSGAKKGKKATGTKSKKGTLAKSSKKSTKISSGKGSKGKLKKSFKSKKLFVKLKSTVTGQIKSKGSKKSKKSKNLKIKSGKKSTKKGLMSSKK